MIPPGKGQAVTKLWTVEVELRYELVVYADTPEQAREVARDNYRDAVDPEEWAHEMELHPGDHIPDGWADSEPYSELDDDTIALGLGMDSLPGRPTTARLMEWMEAQAKATTQRCENTPDMFNLPDGQQK